MDNYSKGFYDGLKYVLDKLGDIIKGHIKLKSTSVDLNHLIIFKKMSEEKLKEHKDKIK